MTEVCAQEVEKGVCDGKARHDNQKAPKATGQENRLMVHNHLLYAPMRPWEGVEVNG